VAAVAATDQALNTKAKGTRAERRCLRILEAAGYCCTKAGGSLGAFDVIAIGSADVRCIQVKSGGEYLSGVEREQLQALEVPANVSRECWRFPDRCRQPIIERLFSNR
jgi:Holliday junction resolvase